MSAALTTAVAAIVTSVKSVWTEIVTEETILPYFIIGIAASVVLLGVKIIRSVVWGA